MPQGNDSSFRKERRVIDVLNAEQSEQKWVNYTGGRQTANIQYMKNIGLGQH